MKREQLVDMIGHAPDAYVRDAKEAPQKQRKARRIRWFGSIAAVPPATGISSSAIPTAIFAVTRAMG